MRKYTVLTFENIGVVAQSPSVVVVVGIEGYVSVFAESLLTVEYSGVSVLGYHHARVDVGFSSDDVFFDTTPVL